MRRPELLAPAGDRRALAAALAAGADAVYLGLDEGFNARARAENFSLATLPEVAREVHRAGAKLYVTLNTLVFEPELAHVERVIRGVAAAGADALIVQDFAVALLARAICPALALHASTQMTISSAEGAEIARSLGITRVVVPRELSVDEIRRFAAATSVELEVFIHGALCVSWSGQCLTSESWGGRSANRGQCAQSCRLPYELVVDGATRDLGDVQYLLSPGDLAGVRAVPDLMGVGVHGLKIEGRQKGPTYVATSVGGYRRWVDAIADAGGVPDDAATSRLATDLGAMRLSYSRGFGDGFLAGSDHQSLVDGRAPRHRGAYLGRVREVGPREVVVVRDPLARPEAVGHVSSPLPALGGSVEAATGAAEAPLALRAGMGVVFDDGDPEREETGGPVFAVETRVLARGREALALRFGTPGPDLSRVAPGQRVWVTKDPAIAAQAERLLERGAPEGRIALTLAVTGHEGAPLRLEARAGALTTHAETPMPLSAARGAGLDAATLNEKLGAVGGTPFRLEALDAHGLAPGLHVPVSALKAVRRAALESLEAQLLRGPVREVARESVLDAVRLDARAKLAALPPRTDDTAPRLLALCRNDAQLDAVIAAGLPEVELDWMELVGLARAVDRARAAGLRVTLATVRVQKPGEEGYDARFARLAPDAVLVRHWGALAAFARRGRDAGSPALHGDFSLNVTNGLAAAHVLSLGLETLTAAHDLDAAQLHALLDATDPARVTVALHHHVPTFHTEHCVYAHLLSAGRDFRTCGRPCEAHAVSLRDRTGDAHPVIVDVGCRNTVFNARAQSAAALVPGLLAKGVRRFRVELVREAEAETRTVLAAYTELLAGRCTPADAVRRVGAHEQFGVTQGTMRVLG
jgi:putative protease